MSWLLEKLESLHRVHVVPPLVGDRAPLYRMDGGRLIGEGVFYVPTGVKFYERPTRFMAKPAGVVLHSTGCHASNRPLKHFDRLVNMADDRLNDTEGAIIDLKLQCEEIGYIPDAVSLTLQNATRARNASWCILIGSNPLPDGVLPVVQYSPNIDFCGTMHAGTPAQLWRARKAYGKRVFKTTHGDIRWDGHNYCWPEVEIPDEPEKTLVVSNVNPYSIGVECSNVGIYGPLKRLKYPGLPTIYAVLCTNCKKVYSSSKKIKKCPSCRNRVKSRLYEKPSNLMLTTLREVLWAFRDRYGDLPLWGHRDFTRSKIDPWPPFPITL